MKADREHVVIQTSTAHYPSDNGWLAYYCQCDIGGSFICAHGLTFKEWATALERFNADHPHKETRTTRWGQPR